MTTSVFEGLIEVVAYDHVVIAGVRVARPLRVEIGVWEKLWRMTRDGKLEGQAWQDAFDEGYAAREDEGWQDTFDEGYAAREDEGGRDECGE